MSTLSADIDKLEEAIRIINEILPEFESLRHGVDNISNELEGTWDGAASEYFIVKLRGHATPLANTREVLVAFRDYAEQSKREMEQLDAALKMLAQGALNIRNNEGSSSATANSSNNQNTNNKSNTNNASSTKNTSSSTSTKSSQKKNTVKTVVETVVDAITSPVKSIINGIKSIIGGKKK